MGSEAVAAAKDDPGRCVPALSVRLTLGPLAYDVCAADVWAEDQVVRLRSALAVSSAAGATPSTPDRRCLLTRRSLEGLEVPAGAAGDLPADLLSLCPLETPRHGWTLGLETQQQATWWHPQSRVCVVGVHPDGDDLSLRLPWYAILRDALSVGGCIVHAGLAALAGRGFLFRS